MTRTIPIAGPAPSTDPLGVLPRITDAEARLARLGAERALIDAIHGRETARVDSEIAAVERELSDLRFARLQQHIGDVELRRAAKGRAA